MHPSIPQGIQGRAAQATLDNPNDHIAIIRRPGGKYRIITSEFYEGIQQAYNDTGGVMWSHPPMVQS